MIFEMFTLRRLLVALVVMVVGSPAFGGVTTMKLKTTVRISGDEALTLGQICLIEGDQFEILNGLVIEELLDGEPGQWQRLDVESLRELLELEDRVHGGSIVLEGDGVLVRRVGETRMALTKIVDRNKNKNVAESGGTVVRDHINTWVRDRYQIGKRQVRFRFRDADDAFINVSTEGRLVEIREISRRGRTSIRVVVYEQMQIVAEQTLIFHVEMHTSVLIARLRVNRGTILDDSHFMRENRWVSPDDHAASAQEALGMAISKTINPGQLLQSQHIELPLVIRRGDIVSAKSIAGSIVVSVRGRAKNNAKMGETVEIESMSGETQFTARATGKRMALIIQNTTIAGDGR